MQLLHRTNNNNKKTQFEEIQVWKSRFLPPGGAHLSLSLFSLFPPGRFFLFFFIFYLKDWIFILLFYIFVLLFSPFMGMQGESGWLRKEGHRALASQPSSLLVLHPWKNKTVLVFNFKKEKKEKDNLVREIATIQLNKLPFFALFSWPMC